MNWYIAGLPKWFCNIPVTASIPLLNIFVANLVKSVLLFLKLSTNSLPFSHKFANSPFIVFTASWALPFNNCDVNVLAVSDPFLIMLLAVFHILLSLLTPSILFSPPQNLPLRYVTTIMLPSKSKSAALGFILS